MFLEHPSERRNITQELREEIIDLRSRRGFSANHFATGVLNKPQSWLAQIETGRTKTISNNDLILVFSALMSSTKEEAEQFLIENYDRLFLANHSTDDNEVFITPGNQKIAYFKPDIVSSERKLRKRYQKRIDHLRDGMLFFFDNISDKEDAMNMLEMFSNNMHYDMGLALSVASLPLFIMDDADSDTKKKVFDSMLNLVKSNSKLPDKSVSEDENSN